MLRDQTMRFLLEKLRAQPPRPIDVVGFGECSLDLVYGLPGRLRELAGGKCRATSFEALGGGQVATALCALRRLGCSTAFLGAIGDDAAGAEVREGLQKEGVATEGLHIVAAALTRSALLLLDADGERTVIERKDAALKVPADYPPPAAIAEAKILHVDATHRRSAVRAARLARQHGVLVSIDVDAKDLAPEGEEKGSVVAELFSLCDLCVVPAELATAFTGESDLEQAALRLGRFTSGQVIVTLGPAGSLAVAAGSGGAGLRRQAALRPPARVRDTTACGDTFRAALLAYLLERASAAEDNAADDVLGAALRFASAAAALKCQDRGRRGCPTRAALSEFLSRLEPAHDSRTGTN